MNKSVTCEVYNEVLLITLDRPKANAIDAITSHALGDAFISFRDDNDLRVAIIIGAGAVSYTHLTLPTILLV